MKCDYCGKFVRRTETIYIREAGMYMCYQCLEDLFKF